MKKKNEEKNQEMIMKTNVQWTTSCGHKVHEIIWKKKNKKQNKTCTDFNIIARQL